jgi:hypothetical protein
VSLVLVALGVWVLLAGCKSTKNYAARNRDATSSGAGGQGGEPGATTTTNGGQGSVLENVTDRPCNDDDDCLADHPRCIDSGHCASCSPTGRTGCPASTSVCTVLTAGEAPVCVACVEDADCPEGSCESNACVVRCGDTDDCPSSAPVCSSEGVCVACDENNDCADPDLSCTSQNECVECLADSDCSDHAPVCDAGTCLCVLDLNRLSTDPANCGACGFACDAGEICAGGACTEPGNSRFTIVAGGGVATNGKHTLVFSSGQAPGGNRVSTSPRFRLHSGFVGTATE